MASVPTPIPESTADLVKSYWRRLSKGSWLDTVWKALVVTFSVLVVYIVVAGGPGFWASFAISTAVAYWYTDDLVQAYRDILNRDFYTWRA